MKMVPEDRDFGMMRWRLLSREVDSEDRATSKILVLPITGVGTWLRTVMLTPEGPRYEDPILIKTALVLEVVQAQVTSPLVDAKGQGSEPEFKCVNRELISVDVAKKRFKPNSRKGPHQDLEILPGSLLTQEQHPMIMPAPAPSIS